jgi:23S rRNA pseudouridine1911/1915/1917 synthase
MNPEAIQILYEQGPCLAVMKPAGILTQAPPGIDSLEERLRSFLIERDSKPGNLYLGVPHRLDRPASGVMLFARHARAARRLAEQFQGRLVRKTYWALVEGIVQSDQDTWIDSIRKIPDQARAELVSPHQRDGKTAILHFQVLARHVAATWLQIELETGRTHQVRVQAAARGHPLLGDQQYGSCQPFGPQVEDPRQRAIALHAHRIEFRHPMTRDAVSVVAPLPDYWPSECLAHQRDERHDQEARI